MESVSISEEPIRRRVIMHSNTAILGGIRDWQFSLAGKLYAPGVMSWQDAERAAKFIWPHLRRHNQWFVQVRGLEPNIFVIKFKISEDKDAILVGGSWNLDGHLIVLKDWNPTMDYHLLDFTVSPFWLEYKYLLPEFTYADILRMFGIIVGEVRVIEPDGVNPPTSSKYRALVLINVNTPLITVITTANVAGSPFCLLKGNPEQEAQLFLQHGSQRHDKLRKPIEQQPRPLDGMRLSIFSATDSGSGASSSYHNQAQPSSSLRPSYTMTSDGVSTSGVKKRYRRTPILVITSEPHIPDADLDDNVVTSQVDDTVSVEDDTTASAMDTVWDIVAASAYNAQNHTDAWQQVIVKTYPSLFIFSLFFLLLFSCNLFLNLSVITVMKILSWNCQGIGNPHTRDYLHFCLTNNDPDIFFLCETKAQSNNMRFYLSKTKYPHYWFHPSLGLSGGISLGWKNGIDIEIMHTTSKTIHVIVHAHDNNMDFLITFMYGAHDDTENANQWQYLINMHLFVDLPWVLLGDLNFTMHDSETHSSSVTHPHHARHVRNFVQQLGLIDLGYSRADTTWSNHRSEDDHVSARLDRALVNNRWINHYTNAHFQHLVPVASDHNPILLHTVPSATKHSPFKLYKCWFKMDSCTDTIARSWKQRFSGSPSFQFSSKLKLTRTQLQIWKRLSFGNIENNLQNIQKQLQFCYDRNLPSSHPQVKHLSSSLQQWLLIQKEFFMQKAGDKFLEEDRNTSYFHSIVNYNKRMSTINSIQGPLGIWFDSRSDIEAIFTNHFKNISTSSTPQINNEILQLFQPCVSEIQNNCLIQVPHAQEIKDVVFQIKPWASPGNDGFQAGFYQHCWDVVGTEVISMVQYFFTHKHMLKAINHTYQVLIPKISNPKTPADYRPIRLCNVSYKIMSKILANRLKPLLPDIISPTQTAFVAGRHIHDNIIIAHEILFSMKRKKIKKALVGLKLDMSKAFDRVEWSFLLSFFRQLGFHSDWISLIDQCISTSNISILINGSPSLTFSPTRGIRQGDPLSPFLFLFVMEAFSRLLQLNVDSGCLSGIRINHHCPLINHLFFADDCLLFFEADSTQMQQLQHLLHIFGQASGQVINMQKSTLFFGKHTSNAHKSNIIGILGMKVMGLGEKYLGIPLLLHRSRHKNCQGVIDNMNNRLQVFKLPEATLQQMERIQRSYWWNSYIKPRSQKYISWRKVCLHKRIGGLGLKNLCNYNLAFLAKLAWKLLYNQDALWAKLLKGKHFPHHDLRFFPPPVNLNSSWIWQSIFIWLEIVLKNAKWQVGNGAHINIWTSNWIPSLNSALQDWGDLNTSNYQLVSDLIDTDTEQWNVSLLRLLFTADQVNSILTIPIQLDQEDKLIWPFTTTGIFTTASTYKMLCDKDILTDNSMGLSQHFWLSFWKLKVPYKFQIFLWRAIHNAIPVKARIFTHVHNADLHCVLCNHNQMEDLDHLLLHFPFSRAIWQYFLPHQFHFTLQHSSLLSWIQTWKLKDSIINIKKSPEIVHLAMCIMHFIWKLRCSVVFNSTTPNHNSVVHQVTSYILQHHLGNTPANYNHPNVHNKLLHHKWEPPPLHYLKINIDASYNSSSLLAGIGIIMRNSTGAYVMGRGALRRASNAQQAEAWAMLEAMQLADSNGWSHVIFEYDNLGICSFLQQQSSLCHWQSMPLLRKCVNICTINPGWSSSFVYRSGNKAADAIAKAAYKHNLCGDWWFHPPPLLIPYINCDVSITHV
ncbi:uncharacterized protein LOC113313084 [Papaver somniferum]|uniref:uncharacterized protein LOC113313084 n=1 Tax=Papaver somniferum TaxID=3469 RepID=UPI000E6F8034|nr:uncharacterized protein LOC113313084 [Papaver somniferum]